MRWLCSHNSRLIHIYILVYIALPELSSFEWHPFSLSSAPHQRVVTMHIRDGGNWTSALYKLAMKKSEVSILMEGPYGNLGVDVMSEMRYKGKRNCVKLIALPYPPETGII